MGRWGLKIIPKNTSYISIDSSLLCFSLSWLTDEFSLETVYPTMVEETVQIYGVQITSKCLSFKKNESINFNSSKTGFSLLGG